MIENVWYERCPGCPPGEDPEGAGMWFAGEFVVICEVCGGDGKIEHLHQE